LKTEYAGSDADRIYLKFSIQLLRGFFNSRIIPYPKGLTQTTKRKITA